MKKIFEIINILIPILLISCQKEAKDIDMSEEVQTVSPNAIKNADPGFAENDMVLYWNQKAEYIFSTRVFGEMEISYPQGFIPNYFFAIIQIAVHDALNSIIPKYECYALKNTRMKSADPRAAVASATYWTIKYYSLQQSVNGEFPIDNWYSESLSRIPDGEAKELGIALGKASSDAIITERSNDNFYEASQPELVPPGSGIGEYHVTWPFTLPTEANYNSQSYPHWFSYIRPFSVQSFDQFLPNPPYQVNSPEYTNDYNEIKITGPQFGHSRTPEQTAMSQFWDEKSPIKWNRLARAAIENKNIDAWKTARLFVLLNTTLADVFSSSIKAKYHFYYWRPETAIQLGEADDNLNTIGNPSWTPASRLILYYYTPFLQSVMFTAPWPEYPSEQSAFGGAAAEVFRLFFGTDITSVDQTSIIMPGETRHYSKFSQAATDNSESQLFLGYDFRNSIEAGENMGKQIGNYVFNHSFR